MWRCWERQLLLLLKPPLLLSTLIHLRGKNEEHTSRRGERSHKSFLTIEKPTEKIEHVRECDVQERYRSHTSCVCIMIITLWVGDNAVVDVEDSLAHIQYTGWRKLDKVSSYKHQIVQSLTGKHSCRCTLWGSHRAKEKLFSRITNISTH